MQPKIQTGEKIRLECLLEELRRAAILLAAARSPGREVSRTVEEALILAIDRLETERNLENMRLKGGAL